MTNVHEVQFFLLEVSVHGRLDAFFISKIQQATLFSLDGAEEAGLVYLVTA